MDNDIYLKIIQLLREFGALTGLNKDKAWVELIENDQKSGKVIEQFGEAMKKHKLRFLNYYVRE